MPAGPDFVTELRRCLDRGDAVLPVDLRLAPPARRQLLEVMAPSAVVERPGDETALRGGRPVEPGDALVMATSGTTGEPKGVVLTLEAIEASARATSARLRVGPGDRWWACLPLSHIGGLSVVLRSLVTGVDCEVVDGYSEAGAAAAVAAGATLVSLVPTTLWRTPPEVLSAFRHVVLGGQAPPEVLPPNVVTTYGLTETGSGLVYDGLPLEGVEVRVDSPGEGSGEGSGPASGEIMVRGPMLLRAYRDGTDPKTADGWFPTGDAGELGPDGRLRVHGRLGDLVISGVENVWPSSVEPILERHPAVAAAAVAGRPDPEWGERVTAFVVASAELSPARLLEELRSLVRDELAGFAAPREVVVVSELPRTAIGKVRRELLAEMEGPSASL